MPIVEISGVGRIEFPDELSDDEIKEILKSKPWEQQAAAQPTNQIPIPPGLGGGPAPLKEGGGRADVAMPPEMSNYMSGGMEQFGNLAAKELGKGFTTLGEGMTAGLADLGYLAMMTQPGRLNRRAPGEVMNWNIPQWWQKHVIQRQPIAMPAELEMQSMPTAVRGAYYGGKGFVESAPRLAAMTGLQALGVPMWAAGGAAFGPTEQGFDPKAAAFGALMPYLGRYGGMGAELAAKRLGVQSADLRGIVNGLVATGGPITVTLLDQMHTIDRMVAEGQIDEKDAGEERVKAIGNAVYMAASGPMGFKRLATPDVPPIIPIREIGRPAPTRAMEGAVGKLSTLEHAYLESERSDNDFPIEVVEKPPEGDDPFVGNFMQASRGRGKILVYAGALEKALLNTPEHLRRPMMRMRLNEENIHLVTPPELAMDYWNSIPAWRKAIYRHHYTAKFGKLREISEQNYADEAVRMEVQRRMRGRTAEVAESDLIERTKMQSLHALERILDFASSRPGGKMQRDVFAHLQRILEGEQQAVQTGDVRISERDPAARQRIPYDDDAQKLFQGMRAAVEDPELARKAQAEADARKLGEIQRPPPAVGEATVRESFRTRPGQQEMDLGVPYARQDQEAAALYGDVRPQPGERQAQVPAQEGGPGVQPPPPEVGPAARIRRTPEWTDQTDLDEQFHKYYGMMGADARRRFSIDELGGDAESMLDWLDMFQRTSRNEKRLYPYSGTANNLYTELRDTFNPRYQGELSENYGSTEEAAGDFITRALGQELLDLQQPGKRGLDAVDLEAMRRYDLTSEDEAYDSRKDLRNFPVLHWVADNHPEVLDLYMRGRVHDTTTDKSGRLHQFAWDRLQDVGMASDEATATLRDWGQGGFDRAFLADRELAHWIDKTVFGKSDFTEKAKRVIEEGPASRIRKTRGQTELDFEGLTSMAPKEIKGNIPQEVSGFRKITPDQLEQSIKSHMLSGQVPAIFTKLFNAKGEPAGAKVRSGSMFDQYAQMAGEQWGISKETLRPYWLRGMWDTLLKASGQELRDLVYKLDLGRSEGREARGMVTGNIEDPAVFGPESIYEVLSKTKKGQQLLKEVGRLAIAVEEGKAHLPEPSLQNSPAMRRRLGVIGSIAMKLMGRTGEHEASVTRKEINPDELAYHIDEPIRTLTEAQRANINELGAVLTGGSQVDRSTIIRKAVDEARITTRKDAPQEAETKALVAFEDLFSGQAKPPVYLASVYKARDGTVRIMSPRSPSFKRAHEPLSPKFLSRYKPLFRLTLDEPVRNFLKHFKDRDDFRREFLSEAKSRQESAMNAEEVAKFTSAEEINEARQQARDQRDLGVLNQEAYEERVNLLGLKEQELASKVGAVPRIYGTRPGLVEAARKAPAIAAPEARSLANALLGKVELESPEDMVTAMKQLRDLAASTPEQRKDMTDQQLQQYSQARQAVIALEKLQKVMQVEATGDDMLTQMARRLYPVAQRGREALVEALMQETQGEAPPPQALFQQGQPERGLPSNLQELQMRTKEEVPIHRRMPVVPARNIPPGQPNPPLAPKELSQEAKEYLQKQRSEFRTKKFKPGEKAMVQKQLRQDPELYRYKMSGWPKFESLGDRPISQFDDPAAMKRLVGSAVRSIGDNALINWYSGWLGPQLREKGYWSNRFIDLSDQVIGEQKKQFGDMSRVFDPAIKAASELSIRHGFNNWLNQKQNVTPNTAIANVVHALEGRVTSTADSPRARGAFRMPTQYEREIALAKVANFEAGSRKFAVSEHGGEPSGKMERILTPQGVEIIRAGRADPRFQDLVKGTVQANYGPQGQMLTWGGPGNKVTGQNVAVMMNATKPLWKRYAEVAQYFEKLKELLDDPLPDPSRIDKIAQDHAREYPLAITHVKAKGEGWQPVLYTHLPAYLRALQNRTSHVQAFRSQFPNTPEGRAYLEKIVGKVRKEQDSVGNNNLNLLLRTLQGHMTDQMAGWGDVTQPLTHSRIGRAAKAVDDTAMNLLGALALTKQMVTQAVETGYGPTHVRLGARATYKAMAQLVRDMVKEKRLGAEYEQRGEINRILYDWSFDQNSPVRSAFRIASNGVQKIFGTNFLNEFQEATAAATAHVIADRIAQGRLSPGEQRIVPDSLSKMGFSPNQVQRIMRGDPVMLDQFRRRAAAWLTSGNKHLAEGSAPGASHTFNRLLRFQTYPMMKMNQLARDMETLGNAIERGEGRLVASEQFMKNAFQNSMQGALGVMLSAWATYGTSGLKTKLSEATESKTAMAKFLFESMLLSVGGPIYNVYNSMKGESPYGGVESIMFPFSQAQAVWDMAWGKGEYKDMDLSTRLGTYVMKRTPGLGVARTALSTFGLANTSHQWRQARNAFYRWQGSQGAPPEEKEFLRAMKSAVNAIAAGDEQGWMDSLQRAVNAKDKESTAQSLRARKILQGKHGELTDEEKALAMERIGMNSWHILEAHDAMIEELARRVAKGGP